MIGKNKQNGQMSFLYQTLKDQLNPRHPLYQLSNTINWKSIENDLSVYYIDFDWSSGQTYSLDGFTCDFKAIGQSER